MMKAVGKFLVVLRRIREKAAFHKLTELMGPVVRLMKMRKLIRKMRDDKELAFIYRYNAD